jgi:WD40 repeat protein
VNDSQRFLLEHFDTIYPSPSQIYHSALQIIPPSSWLHQYYTAELPGEVKVVKGFPTGWGAHSRTVKFNFQPLALTCWKNILAVDLWSGDIITLNVITGSQVAVLSGHTDKVESLAFFPDGTSLVSGSRDTTVKLWDVQTGGVVKVFCGHTDLVYSVSISSNHTTIASGSKDCTIRLWDIQMGECNCVMKQQDWVDHVVFSPTNPQHLISASGGLIQKWDTNGHQVGPTHKGTCAAFSPDGTHFISCQEDVSTIQNIDSRVVVAKCQTPNYKPTFGYNLSFVDSCFSPNGRLVAAATGSFVYVWDITGPDPLLVETLVGDNGSFSSLTFSSPSTLISASYSGLVKFWQIDGLPTIPVAGGPKSIPHTSVSIYSVSLQAENGIAISSDRDGVVRTWDLSTGLCKTSFQTPLEDAYGRDAWMIDGRSIFVWFAKGGVGEGIKIWDTEKARLLQEIYIPQVTRGSLRVSGDGSQAFLHTGKFIQAWSIQTGEAVGMVEVGKNLLPGSPHVDGSRIWVSFKDKPTQGWEFGVPGSSPVPLSNISSIPSEKLHLHLIHKVESGDIHGQAWIEDTATGKQVFQLSGRYAEPNGVQWDGHYLVAGYESGEMLILAFCDVHPL